jgi:hypothetical protein
VQITAAHRWSAQIFGGWGAHLGHLLRNASGERWYVDDTGSDVNVNAGLAYFSETGAAWSPAGTNPLPGTVQQNTGSLMSGSTIFTYGLDVMNERIVECTTSGCTSLPFDTGASSNYLGATISKSGTRVVWWTNTTGLFNYIYNSGGGWNGPVSGAIAGYPDIEYVYARLASDGARLEVQGSCAHSLGGADVGYDAVYGSTTLGNAVTNWQLLVQNGLAMETWLDPLGGTHLVSYDTAGPPHYFYKPTLAALTGEQILAEPGAVSVRILETATTAFLLIGFADGHVGYKAIALSSVNGSIDWNSIPEGTIAVPPGAGAITLLPECAMYETAQAEAAFALDGFADQGTIWFIGCQ